MKQKLIIQFIVTLLTSPYVYGFVPGSFGVTKTPINSMRQTGKNVEFQLKAACLLDGQEIRGPITPLGNFVLVRTKESLAATGGGILLPDQVSADTIEYNCCLVMNS